MKKQSKKQSKKPSKKLTKEPTKKLSERAKRLKDVLVMMEHEPKEFAQEPLCDPRLLIKLLPESCDKAIVTDPSPRRRTGTTLRFKVLEYIANDILIREQNAILGSLFLWEKFLNLPEVGKYRSVSLGAVANYWCEPGSLIKFMNEPMKQYLDGAQKKEFFISYQEFNPPGNGISLLLDSLQPVAVQSRDDQVRTFNNYLNATVERMALEIERVSLETLGISALATAPVVHPGALPPGLDVMEPLRELMRRMGKVVLLFSRVQMNDATVICRTIETSSGAIRENWIGSAKLFWNTSGVLISPPHTGKTTYVKMLALKNAEAGSDRVVVYISAIDLKTYAQLKRSVYEFIANLLIGEKLFDIESFDEIVAALQRAERLGKIILFIDNLEALTPELQSAVILQFALCRQVFFMTTPWAAESVTRSMVEYYPVREIKTYSLGRLGPTEQAELVSAFEQQYPGFQEAANKFLAHTYSNLFEQPIGLAGLLAEYLRMGDELSELSELFTTQQIFNSLLVQHGLNSYQIDFNDLSIRNYRMWFLGRAMVRSIEDGLKSAEMGNAPELFWPEDTLHEVFGVNKDAQETFVRTFIEPDPHNPHLMRFFFKDFHYLLAAINYVLPYLRYGRFNGSYGDVAGISCVPRHQRSPALDPNSIVRLYQMNLLTYIMRREAEVGLKWKL